MSEHYLSASGAYAAGSPLRYPEDVAQRSENATGAALAAAITRRASTQTFTTIRLLVDRPLVADAYRAYAYFRWLDDYLDQNRLERSQRLSFIERQRALITQAYLGDRAGPLAPEEQLVADLIRHDGGSSVGLQSYIDNMMNVMAFDAERRGRLISQNELADYTRWLATAVTEALHHFIGHGSPSPRDDTRYMAVTAAHITHMLRDAIEDAAAGYFNIPQQYLETHQITSREFHSEPYRAWVRSQVELARRQFQVGRGYLARVVNPRCRLAGYAYVARFELVLDAIERDEFRLRADYPERKSAPSAVKMVWSALSEMLRPPPDLHSPLANGRLVAPRTAQ